MNDMKVFSIGKIVNEEENVKVVVEHPITPDWCAHWPKSYEESSGFDWEYQIKI